MLGDRVRARALKCSSGYPARSALESATAVGVGVGRRGDEGRWRGVEAPLGVEFRIGGRLSFSSITRGDYIEGEAFPARPRSPLALITPLAVMTPLPFPGARRSIAGTAALLILSPMPLGLAAAQEDSFVERAQEAGITHKVLSGFDELANAENGLTVRDWTQTGLSLGDVDGDGDVDVVAVGSVYGNAIYLNNGAGGYEKARLPKSIDRGEVDRCAALGDYDRDGDLDLYIGAGEGRTQGDDITRDALFEQVGPLDFVDVTRRAGVGGSGRTVLAQWHDLDVDGELDLYLSQFFLTRNDWYRNNGNKTFTELATERGIDDAGSTHACAIYDSDGDGDFELHVGNDFVVADVIGIVENYGDAMYDGDANGFFTDVSPGSGVSIDRAIMGLALGDVNYDGRMDIYKTDVGANPLMRDNGWLENGTPWNDVTNFYGVANQFLPFEDTQGANGFTSGWACMFIDVDLDSYDDLYLVNGHVAGKHFDFSWLPRNQQNLLWRCRGPLANFQFQDITAAAGLFDEYDDRAGAFGDMDADGDIDLFAIETAGFLRYYENRIERDGRSFVELLFDAGTSAAGGAGAWARWVDPNGNIHTKHLGADGPTAGQNESLIHFGISTLPSVDIEVHWPSGMVHDLQNVPANSRQTLVEPSLYDIATKTLPAAAPGSGAPNFEVIVDAHDIAGQPLGTGALVSIDVPGLSATGAVEDLGDGRYRRFFSSEAPAGAYRVEVDMAGFQPFVRPQLFLLGSNDSNVSRVDYEDFALTAGSSDSTVVTIVPCDSQGVAQGAGQTVTFELPGLGSFPVTDEGDGSYTVTLVAPATPGLYSPIVVADGVALNAPDLEVATALADPATTEVRVIAPIPIQAASPDVIRVEVTPRDAAGLSLGGHRNVQVVPFKNSAVHIGGPVGNPHLQGVGLGNPGGAPVRGALNQSATVGGGKFTGPELPELEPLPVETSPRRNGTYLFAWRLPALLNAEQDSELMSLIIDGVEVLRFDMAFEKGPSN